MRLVIAALIVAAPTLALVAGAGLVFLTFMAVDAVVLGRLP